MVPEFYRVGADGRVSSNVPFPLDMARQSSLARIESIILEEVKRVPLGQRYKLGEVLFSEDLDDESLAGWMFLQGVQDSRPDGTETWIAPNYVFRWDSRAVHRAERNPETGLYRFKHRDRKTLSEFGVVNGPAPLAHIACPTAYHGGDRRSRMDRLSDRRRPLHFLRS